MREKKGLFGRTGELWQRTEKEGGRSTRKKEPHTSKAVEEAYDNSDDDDIKGVPFKHATFEITLKRRKISKK